MQTAYHHVMSYIEFTPFVEKWFLYVFLDYVCLYDSIRVFLFLFENVVELVYLVNNSNALATVGQLTWLDDPYIFIVFVLSKSFELFTEGIILWISSGLLDMIGKRYNFEDVST